ncbi:concanavalin A-like lectin/glucanase [Gymnopus androsaceus JB14]|uniref:Concanavalin A-like lectin/glucanase n=1 Tax=Gymnopus androsaceus JB14 TaxID=1447944 RepID=A0A6A4GMH8_9AGAR|nr:concanavalin A-like lectin/glucanase [Gymnopus androsaceus JB14]
MAADSSNNSYVKDGYLYIVPTLTSNVLPLSSILNNAVFNIAGCNCNMSTSYTQGTTDADLACSAVSNATAGTVINPVQSARLNTMERSSIRYGRVELSLAIWILPVNNTYGTWTMSGNGPLYTFRGSNYIQGSLNWGPTTFLNDRRKVFNSVADSPNPSEQDFHTYVLEWTPTFMKIYIDIRLKSLLFLKTGSQSEILQNPWVNGTNAMPFDQKFYLILNVAVIGANGWFPDGQGDKPCIDASNSKAFFSCNARFHNAQSTWSATWPEDDYDWGMVMRRHCDC